MWQVITWEAPGSVPATERADGRADGITRALARRDHGAWHVALQHNGRAVLAWHRR